MQGKFIPYLIFLANLGFAFFSNPLLAQDPFIQEHFSKKEKSEIKQGDQLELEAEKLFNEASIIKGNFPGSDSEWPQSKEYKLWKKKMLDAFKKSETANSNRSGVYLTKAENFRKSFKEDLKQIEHGSLLEDKAREDFMRASQIRTNSSKESNVDEQFKWLAQSLEFEKSGIILIQEALSYYYAWPVSYTQSEIKSSNVQNIENPVLIPVDSLRQTFEAKGDQEKKNVRFLEKTFPAQESDTGNFLKVSAYDIETLKRAWYAYHYGPGWENILPEGNFSFDSLYADLDPNTFQGNFKKPLPGTSSSLQTKSLLASKGTESNGNTPNSLLKDSIAQEPLLSDVKSGTDHLAETDVKNKIIPEYNQPTKTSTETEKSKSSFPEEKGNKVYRVQIAASKHPVSQSLLRKIYSGNKEITFVNEGGWNKYSIGDFSSWEEANKFRKESGITDAFIVTFSPGVSNPIPDDREISQTPEVGSPGSIEFRVQIAASRIPLSQNELKQIYSGNRQVLSFKEDNWYKYYIASVPSFHEAKDVRNESGIKQSFIAAYRNGVKTELYQAIRESGKKPPVVRNEFAKGTIPPTGKFYYIQIAASHSPLSFTTVESLISQKTTIYEFEEEGWYKYRILPSAELTEAKSNRISCGAEGAFIVSFRDGKKISVGFKSQHPSPGNQGSISIKKADPMESGTIFYIQIAADKNPLSEERIQNLCPGTTEFYEFSEDGLYKYRIRSGNSYKEANKVKKRIPVEGAFIVAIKNGRRSPVTTDLIKEQ